MSNIFYLSLAIIFNVVGNLLMKKFSTHNITNGVTNYISFWFFAGAFFFGLNLIFYSKSLQVIPLSIAYPVLVGISVALSTIGAYFIFGEKILFPQLIGAFLIIAGIVSITYLRN